MNKRLFTGIVLAAVCVSVQADTLKVEEMSSTAKLGTAQYPQIFLNPADFKTAVLAEVSGDGLAKQTAVERADAGSVAAAYAGVAKSYAEAPVTSPAETGPMINQLFDFKKSKDAAQAWATMRSNGMQYVMTNTFGKAEAAGTASWTAKLTVPAGGYLYVRFTLPDIKVTGNLEQDGPGKFQARYRADLLVNGFPAWTTEAIRANMLNKELDDPKNCTIAANKKIFLSTFGKPFDNNFMASSDENTSSVKKVVTLKIGPLEPGQVVDVKLVARMDAENSAKCCTDINLKPLAPFCTRATAEMGWPADAEPVKFWSGPAY